MTKKQLKAEKRRQKKEAKKQTIAEAARLLASTSDQPRIETQTPTAQETTPPNSERKHLNNILPQFKNTNLWVAICTVVLAAAAVTQCSVTHSQLKDMEGQLSQSVSQTRPWVGVESITSTSLDIDDNGTARIVFHVTAENFGGYPAQHVFSYAELMVSQEMTSVYKRERELANEPHPDSGGEVLFPGGDKGTYEWQSEVTKDHILRNAEQRESTGVFLAWAVGCVIYRDQFGIRHSTGFCYRLQPPGKDYGLGFEALPNMHVNGVWVVNDGFVN